MLNHSITYHLNTILFVNHPIRLVEPETRDAAMNNAVQASASALPVPLLSVTGRRCCCCCCLL